MSNFDFLRRELSFCGNDDGVIERQMEILTFNWSVWENDLGESICCSFSL